MNNKLLNVLKSKSLVIPKIILSNAVNLNINAEEILVISLILSYEEPKVNFEKYALELGMEKLKVMEIISNLEERKLLNIDFLTNEDGKKEEIISLNLLFNKLLNIVLDKEEEKKEVTTSIYDIFEKEFGRTLSPMEYEIISGWLEANFLEEIIICALKEAIYNGVSNLRYIDKILYEWNKKGYKSREDIERGKRKRYDNKEKVEVFDYNWLDDDDE